MIKMFTIILQWKIIKLLLCNYDFYFYKTATENKNTNILQEWIFLRMFSWQKLCNIKSVLAVLKVLKKVWYFKFKVLLIFAEISIIQLELICFYKAVQV